MKNLLLMVLLAVALTGLLDSTACAAKFGLFADISEGSGEAEWDSDFEEWDIDLRTWAGGFVLDTAPTNESAFNYRLNVGVARHTFEDEDDIEVDSNGAFVENVFGFALIKKENFRWWLGPLVRVGFYSGESDTFREGTTTGKIDLDYGEFGVGFVSGLNFQAGHVVLSPSIGVRYSGFAGEGEQSFRSSGGTITEEEDIEGHTTTGFANLAILF